MPQWTVSDMPTLHGRRVVVTGPGGLGFEDALALARGGASVTLAGRNSGKGQQAVARLRQHAPGASVDFALLDLASLASIAAFAAGFNDRHGQLDILINNAGVMAPPTRQTTIDGFELQFATNYLGHFALTAHLLPLLRKGDDPRVISLSSVAARSGAIDFEDLQAERNYRPMPVYAQSKLACLMFAFELQRRSTAGNLGVTSIAAHPGISRTDLLHNAPGRTSAAGMARSLLWFLFQPVSQGALPTLFAATSPDAEGGGYYGPDKFGETRGYPAPARRPAAALDPSTARRLWEVSEHLTQTRFGQSA